MKAIERARLIHTQEVRGSSPCAPTIIPKDLPVRPSHENPDFGRDCVKTVPKPGSRVAAVPKLHSV